MKDEQFFLANAYLDGELDAEDRRIAAADPDVMAEVERLRAIQAEMRAVAPPSSDARDLAIAAALAEFEQRAPARPENAPVVPIRQRPALRKYLAVAAALVAVAGLGIVIARADLGGDDDDAFSDVAVSETLARSDDVTDAEETAEEMVEEMAEADSEQEAQSAPADAAGGEAAGEEATTESGVDDDVMAAEDADGAPASEGELVTRVEVPTEFDPDEPLRNEVDLAFYGAYVLELAERRELGPTPETRCDGPFEILDTAIYVLGGAEREVYVAVNDVRGFVLALDVDTCIELANGSLF